MRALVTGGGGFLGLALCRRLLAEGHQVTAASRHEHPELAEAGVRFARMELADPASVRAAVAGHDTVFHAAARAGVWGDRADYVATNVRGTENVVRACRESGVRRLVFTSSPSVVFDGRDHEGVGELPYAARYEAAYPETKAEAERTVLAANGEDLATVALRPHLVWGPRDPHLLPRVFAQAARGRLRVVGDGRNRVSVTYVDNAVAAHVQAAAVLAPGSPAAGRAFFVNDAEPVALWPWLNGLLTRLGLPPVRRRVPLGLARAAGAVAEAAWSVLGLRGEPPLTRFVATQLARSHWYDLGPARAAFGFEPPVGEEEALDRTVAWWATRLPGAKC